MGRDDRQRTRFSEGDQATHFLMSARSKAEWCESSAREEPFWRFRRRARLKDRARRARAIEARLLEMAEDPDRS